MKVNFYELPICGNVGDDIPQNRTVSDDFCLEYRDALLEEVATLIRCCGGGKYGVLAPIICSEIVADYVSLQREDGRVAVRVREARGLFGD